MSAFVVEDSTINKIVAAIRNDNYMTRLFEDLGYLPHHVPRNLAEALFDMNCDAVEARYGHGDTDGSQFTYKQVLCPTSVPAYKHMSCLLYQCSEGDIPTTPLYQALEQCKSYLASGIISSLPEYEAAQWG